MRLLWLLIIETTREPGRPRSRLYRLLVVVIAAAILAGAAGLSIWAR